LEIHQLLKRIENLWYIAEITGLGLRISKRNCLNLKVLYVTYKAVISTFAIAKIAAYGH